MQALKFCYFMALEIYEIIVFHAIPIDMGTDYSWISERLLICQILVLTSQQMIRVSALTKLSSDFDSLPPIRIFLKVFY